MSNLTEEQYSIMAGFSYLDFTDDQDFEKYYKGKKLGDLSNDLLTIDPTTGQPEFYKYMGDRIIGGRTKEDYKQLLETIAYDNKHDELRNLELKGFANKNSTSGFVGYAFDMNNKKDTFYAIRGSESYPNEGTASTDWVDNFKMGLENYSNQFKDTEEFFLKHRNFGQVYTVGHSKGGINTAYIASKYDNVSGYNFNSPGIAGCLSAEQMDRLSKSGLTNILARNDLIGHLLLHSEKIKLVDVYDSFFARGGEKIEGGAFDGHYLQAFKFDKDGNTITADESTTEAKIASSVSKIIWSSKEIASLFNGNVSENLARILLSGIVNDNLANQIKIGAVNLLELGARFIRYNIGCSVGKFSDFLSDLFKEASEIRRIDPLVLDLNGDGIQTTALKEGVHFDLDNNTFAEKTGWISKEDGILVYDKNKNNIIDSGAELFGDQTILENGEKATGGFHALLELDKNKDGKISKEDESFADLRVWKDLNQDGISSEDELFKLSELQITAINLKNKDINQELENGNKLLKQGSFIKEDAPLNSGIFSVLFYLLMKKQNMYMLAMFKTIN